jgi:uncharacterized protein (DUF2147 family)
MPNVSSILPHHSVRRVFPTAGRLAYQAGPSRSVNQLKPAAARSDAACGQSLAFQSWSAWRAPFGLARALKVATMERMKLSMIGGASAVALIAVISAGTALADPKGVWLAQDGARVRVGPCGGALCATIATPKSAADPETGRPWTDKNNPDPALRNRPLVGVAVLSSLVPEGPGRWSGRLYNIDNGQSYSGRLLEIDPRTIRVEGCAIGICGGQNMVRIK